MISNEKLVFLQVLSDFINKEKSVIPSTINLEQLHLYAKKHEVLGIFYYQTKLPVFLSAYSSTLYVNCNREKLLDQLHTKLKVPYFIVKGSEIAKYYPVPLLRTMGDTDIVVHTCDRESVHNSFVEIGFNTISKYQDREWQYVLNRMEFELHDHLIYSENVNNPKQEEFFNDFWKYVSNNRLEKNFHFLFLISHLRKHFMNEGVGFRQFMDIAIMVRYADLDWKWINNTAETLELLSFLKIVLAFCNKWFKIGAPIDIVPIENDFYEESTNKIFKDGIFGFDNEDNDKSAAVNEIRTNGRLGVIRKWGRLLFPSYKTLQANPRYSFIAGKPYLLPFIWGYRIIIGEKSAKRVRKLLNESLASTKQITEREKLYQQWGL